MSIDALSWAFNLDLPNSGTKLTLLALANYADEKGVAFPSQKAMSVKTCLCERAIRTHLVTLEEIGIITREARTRANGSFTSDLFKLNIGAVVTSGKSCQRQILPTADSSLSQRQILPNPAAESAAPDPSLNTTVTNINRKAPVANATLACPFKDIIDLYHECLPDNPKVLSLNATRKAHIQARWRQCARGIGGLFGYKTVEAGLACWKFIFDTCASSKFLTGQVPPSPGRKRFIADIDFIFNESSFTSIIENKYHGEASSCR